MNLTSTKAYGRLVLAVIVSVALWSAWDGQAGMDQPGWFAGVRSTVWCRTVVSGSDFGTGAFFHYPGKRLARVLNDLQVPARFQAQYLNAEHEETICFDSWKEAALADVIFQLVAQTYPDAQNDWTEEDYQRAVLMLHLQPDGKERLEGIMKTQQLLKEQKRQN